MKLPDRFLVYLFAVAILGLFSAFRISWVQEQKIPRNDESTLVFVIEKEPRISGNSQQISVGDARLYTDLFPRYRVGDKLRVEGQVDEKGRIFNAKVQLEQEQGPTSGFGRGRTLLTMISDLRRQISDNIKSYLPAAEASLVVGSVLGVDDIDPAFRQQLIDTGTIHVVVVSGQNLMIVAGMFLALSKFLGRRVAVILATLAVFAYATLAGFEPPVLRASLMVLATTVAIYFGRETSALWSLLVAALLIIFIWPTAIFEVSFQLTFAATLGIVTLGRKLSELSYLSHLRYLRYLIFDNASIAVSAYLFTAPVIFYHFERVSLIAPLTNILVVEAVFPIMIFGFLTAGASLIFAPLAQLFAWFAYVPALYFVKAVEVAAWL